MRILIIDDEVRLTRHLTSALTEAGHDPVVVHDGAVALREMAVAPFDLMVLDVGLPGMDGFEVLRQIRERRITTRVLDADRARRTERSPHRVEARRR